MKPESHISPDRLFEAAEEVAGLVREAVDRAGGWVSAGEVLRGSHLAARLPGFSASELREAAEFLIRMGIIEVR
jgi:hypothetical protein